MASGSAAGRASSSGFKGGVYFASDDVLCSYEDYGSQDASNGGHSNPVTGANTNKDFHKSRVSRSSVFPTSNAYTQPEDPLNEEVIITVERIMKKYADNLMRFLEGISSRLSQLELYCYNLDKSVGEMRSELGRDHGDAGAKLKSLDKHLQEVQKSVQILRDKQELADAQKELAELQLLQKEASRSQQEETEKVSTPVSVSKKTEDLSEMKSQQLALVLALPNQVAPQASLLSRASGQQQSVTAALPSQIPPQTMTQLPPYYTPATQSPNPAAQPQPSQGPYLPADSQYRAQQPMQNPSQGQLNQAPKLQQLPQYQQQWAQPVAQPPAQPAQPQPVQSPAQIRAPPSPLYAPYMPSQPTNPPQEALTSSVPMQMPYGYGGSGGTHAPVSSGGSYMMYDGEGSRSHQARPTHFSQAGYHPANIPLHNPHPQPPTSAGLIIRGPSPPQFVRSNPYNELIDKLVSMGYGGDHVASVIQRLEESGQPVDFNAVLDRLNGHSSGSSQRSW